MKNTITLSLLALGATLAPAVEKPNILLIMIDDLNTMVGCFDGPAYTPNMDAFAEGSLRFHEAYSPSPSCNPSRTAMLTGQRPETTRVWSNSVDFRSTPESRDLITLPQYLKANGYNTLAAGKIFHARRGGAKEANPHSDPVSWTFQAEVASGQFFGPDFQGQFLDDHRVPKWVGSANPDMPLKQRKKIKSTWSYGPIDVDPENTLDFNSAAFGAAWLNQDMSHPEVAKAPKRDDQPFFLACGIFRPHIPILAPTEFFDLYETDEHRHRLQIPDDPEDDIADIPKIANLGRMWFNTHMKHDRDEWQKLWHAYMAAATYADAAVGIILDGLAKSGVADNTLVVIMGDHGFHLGDKARVGKSACWRGAAGMPLIVRMPGMPAGETREAVSMIDLYPTIMDLLDLEAPQPLAGTSWMPLIEDPGSSRSEPVVVSTPGGNQISVVHQGFHYIQYTDGSGELYDHRNDLEEYTNLLYVDNVNEKYLEIAKRLAKNIPAAHYERVRKMKPKKRKSKKAIKNPNV